MKVPTRRSILLLGLIATACERAPADPLASFADAQLCGDGTAPGPAAPLLFPTPRRVGRLGDPRPLAAPTLARGTMELELPALDRVAVDAGLTLAPEATAAPGGMVVHVLGGDRLEALARRCGVAAPEGPEAHALVVRAAPSGGAEAVIFARARAGASRAAALLGQTLVPAGAAPFFPGDRAPPRGPARFAEAAVLDGPATAVRGVLEGFYGPAWWAEERAEMLRFTFRARMNVMVWAPKSDFGSRILWRGDYPEETVTELRALAAEARELDVDFCAEVSPGNGILYSDPAERALLVKKLDGLAALGASCLLVAFDDIPRALRPEDAARYPGGLGEAQADLAAAVYPELRARHPEVRLGFTPTDYATRDMDAHPEYTRALAARLPADVFLGWTGEEIVSPTVAAADVRRVQALWGRAPFMGDNYPVSDGAREVGRIQLGPVVGREAEAIGLTTGWVANALCLPRASAVALGTMAAQLWAPDTYEPEEAWQVSLRATAGEGAAALEFFAAHARSSALEPRDAAQLAALGEASLATFPAESPALAAHFARMAEVEAELEPLGALARELRPWARALAAYGRAGGRALALVAELRAGRAADAAALEALRDELKALAKSDVKVGGGVPDELLGAIVARLAD